MHAVDVAAMYAGIGAGVAVVAIVVVVIVVVLKGKGKPGDDKDPSDIITEAVNIPPNITSSQMRHSCRDRHSQIINFQSAYSLHLSILFH